MRRSVFVMLFVSALVWLGLAPNAGAGPVPVTIAGAATPAQVSGPGTTTFTYTITVSGVPATGVVITTAQDALLPANTPSIRLDGAAVPAATVTAAAADFTLRAGAGADATNGGTLAVGTHTLSFSAAVSSTAAAQTTSTATIVTDSGTASAAPVTVALNQPDLALALPPDSGEDQSAPLGTGATIYFAAELRNLGAAAGAQLTIVLPTGLELGSDGVVRYADLAAYDNGDSTPLNCVGTTGTITCALGTVAATGATADPPVIEVALTATPAGVPGTSATFTVSVAPTSAVDTDESNNSVHATIDFTGIAHLTYAITPSAPNVVVGHSSTLTLSITNHGPQDATQALGISLLDNDTEFGITGFDGNTTPPAGSPLARMALSSGPPGSGFGVLWYVGTIPAGQTVTAHLTVQAKALGSAHVALFAISGAANPDCVTDADPCAPALATLTAVAAPGASPPTPHTPSAVTSPELANTGTTTQQLTLTGLALLVAGGVATAAGRRRAC